VARIDAHLLNRRGVTRLCYCGPVLHTRPSGLHGSREPLQFGAELFGHAGLEADLEIQELAIDCLARAGLDGLVMDLADARVLEGLLCAVKADAPKLQRIQEALAAKDAPTLAELTADLPVEVRDGLRALPDLYGGDEVLAQARERLPRQPAISAALDDLTWLAQQLRTSHPGLRVGFDLADLSGYAYYSGARFALYAPGGRDTLARGGRYDDVGEVFGRRRPAVGFSLDLKSVVEHVGFDGRHAAIRAPWSEDRGLRAAVRRLRVQGEAVVCVLPGHEQEVDEFECDRELVAVDGLWVVRAC
jgi:ATP phosphoribosyltransferase regulatory subunit